MELLALVPYLFLTGCAFVFGLMVGSFLNVLIARMPYEKSIVWPSSRCFACYRPIRWLDNVPIIGYLRLRGRCRKCGAAFSARYMWVELGTGLAFAAVFVVEVLFSVTGAPWGGPVVWLDRPGVVCSFWNPGPQLFAGVIVSAAHCYLLASLIAASVIDARHRIIPLGITYTGTLVGLIVSTACPWPWPNPVPNIPPTGWTLTAPIPLGVAHWPFWGPLPEWAPAGSPQLGFLNGLIGAAVGMLIGRGIKVTFELGMGREALGIGDADLLMMSGAFLGWQVIALALPVGAVLSLVVIIPAKVWAFARGRRSDNALAFGPGLAAGVVACWFGWPWLGTLVRVFFFDLFYIGVFGGVIGVGLVVAGLLLRRKPEPATT